MSEEALSEETPAPEEQSIRLDQFLKFGQLVESGGQAKIFIQQGEVMVNGEVELRRGRKLRHGDTVEFDGDEYDVQFGEEADQ